MLRTECLQCSSATLITAEWVARDYLYRAYCECCSKVTWFDRDGEPVPAPAVRLDVRVNVIRDEH